MSAKAENAKKVIGKLYSVSTAAALQRIVGEQTVDALSNGYVRCVKPNTTNVVLDHDEKIITVIVGQD